MRQGKIFARGRVRKHDIHNSLSATAKVVRLLFDGEFTPLYENSIIEEYQEVLHRAKFKFNRDYNIKVIMSDFV